MNRESKGTLSRTGSLLFPGAYAACSVAARSYKFGDVAFSLRSLSETLSAALVLYVVILLALRVLSGRLSRRVVPVAIFSAALAFNLLGMQLAGITGLPPSVRLLPQIPDLMFIQTTIQDAGVASSLLKAGGFWLTCTLGVGAAWWWMPSGAGGLGWRPQLACAALGVAFAVGALFTTQHLRSLDRDAWVAFMTSVPGGTQAGSPARTDDAFESIAWLEASPARSEQHAVDPPRHIVIVVWETGVPDAIGWPDDAATSLPNLDALRRESIVAERHLSTSPQSTKSIFSIVTGLYPQPSAQVETRLRPDAEWPAMGRTLGKAGYDSCVMTSFTGSYDRQDEFFRAVGFEAVEDRHTLGLSPLEGLPMGRDDELTDRAGQWLEERGNGKSLLMLLPSNSHHPFWSPDGTGEDSRAARYRLAMRWQDRQLGRLIARLRKAGMWNTTMLVVCADHGNYHELVPGVGREFIGRYHVPMLVRVPGVPSRSIEAPTSHVDVLPTLLDAAGLGEITTQGQSLLRAVPPRLVFQSACYTTLRISCSDDRRMLVVTPETGEEAVIDWHAGGGRVDLSTMRERLARFHPYQYWRIEDRLNPRD